MGPVATKVMKGYSEEDIRGGDDFKVYRLKLHRLEVLKSESIKNITIDCRPILISKFYILFKLEIYTYSIIIHQIILSRK